ncbi:MAG: hypothetical protein ACR2QF_07055 [Geminicoccaceae bacterium]
MTRNELAIFLREHANALQLPLEDGTELDGPEKARIEGFSKSLGDFACWVEFTLEADENLVEAVNTASKRIALGVEADAD